MCIKCNGLGYMKKFCRVTERFEYDECWTCRFNEMEEKKND